MTAPLVADVVVDGVVLATAVPVTHLLFLDKQLSDMRTFIAKRSIQMSVIKDPEEFGLWIKGRQRNNLRAYGNPKLRMIGVADISTSDYILCHISAFRSKKRFAKLINIVMKTEHNDGEMFNNWIGQIMPESIFPTE